MNLDGLKSYDCSSPYHVAASHHCTSRGVSMFSRSENEEFSRLAALTLDDYDHDDESSDGDDDGVLNF